MCERTWYIPKVLWTTTFYGRYIVPSSTYFGLWISLYGESSQESVLILMHERNADYLQFGKLYSANQILNLTHFEYGLNLKGDN